MVFRRLAREMGRTALPALLVLLALSTTTSAWAAGVGKRRGET